MLHIDGAMGEGGGQVLRTALGLSLVTGEPFRIDRIRAGRERPGLQRQHLTSVLAAAEVGGARVEGAELGSQTLAFHPGRVRAGDYRFAIGTAGSTTLVLQTILPGLLSAEGPSTVELSGGTHNQMAPPFDFLQQAFAPVLHRMGAGLVLALDRHGFYPAGGGRWRAMVAPAAWQPVSLLERGAPRPVRARILIAQIPGHVAEREAKELRTRLHLPPEAVQVEAVSSAGPGNVVMVLLPAAALTEVVTAFGERGVKAEAVAAHAATEAESLLRADVPVGAHLADQLLIPMALAGGGEFRTTAPSLHTRTNAEVIGRFLAVRFELTEDTGRPGTWLVAARRR